MTNHLLGRLSRGTKHPTNLARLIPNGAIAEREIGLFQAAKARGVKKLICRKEGFARSPDTFKHRLNLLEIC
ncbi:hypothetical protein CEN44_14980 [Fischerella muscicola CCMEE 5323]|uniref:Uncharacterized protein n=1 Tax=Fischerella muscicola CCMEE 5323 TaxID=2019572 RepID=A0A2N6K1Q8_FISMU|nr:hypothetical protein CEN44_14980 [Fischerella muscicola CCMEE 5323]